MTSTLEIVCHRAQQQLQSPVGNANATWTCRDSLLVQARDPRHAARAAFGEATPLPNYSPETLDDARRFLDQLPPLTLPSEVKSAKQVLDALSPQLITAPGSARFALECAALNHFFGQQVANKVASPRTLPRHAQLLNLDDTWQTKLVQHLEQGIRCFKVKVGRDWPAELTQLSLLCEHELNLRLDANGSLSLEALSPIAAQLTQDEHGQQRWKRAHFEYLEEPCSLASLGRPGPLPIPIALDESLWQEPESALAWVRSGHCAAVVLKPMVLGIQGCLHWAARAKRASSAVILSHLFDGAVAHAAYVQLAQYMGSPGQAMGLGAHPGLGLWQEQASQCPPWQGDSTLEPV